MKDIEDKIAEIIGTKGVECKDCHEISTELCESCPTKIPAKILSLDGIYTDESVIGCEEIDCIECRGSGIRGTFEHFNPVTGEHQGSEDIECDKCIKGKIKNPVTVRMQKERLNEL